MDLEMNRYLWALNEDVRVTLVAQDPDGATSTYLVERTERWDRSGTRPSAFVVGFAEVAITVNGVDLDFEAHYELDNWAEALTTLADAVALGPDPKPGSSVTTRYEAE